uniref:Uncharacterized protein n=1 Tax=Palpitomonas bilix TaxID=652834 RepID=A0A7S3GG89_9EUKA|mmetsp:Transcript_47905/g.124370  ORF Transcript_47905/g.124370 Transcript_47905/m.124370 type:complete len:192 (+) Transcript_47905:1491-2066(+)
MLFAISSLIRFCVAEVIIPHTKSCYCCKEKVVRDSSMSCCLALASDQVVGTNSYNLQKQTRYRQEIGAMESLFVQAGEASRQGTLKNIQQKRSSVFSTYSRSFSSLFRKSSGQVLVDGENNKEKKKARLSFRSPRSSRSSESCDQRVRSRFSSTAEQKLVPALDLEVELGWDKAGDLKTAIASGKGHSEAI